MDVSAIDSARFVDLIDSPAEDIVMTAAGLDIGGVPVRTANLKLRWPVPHEPLDPDEPFPEILNQVELGVSGDGPSDLALTCVDSGCRASVTIHAAALDGPVISTAGVQVVKLGLDVAPLTSWEFLQGFGVPEQEIGLSAPQDLAIIRQWRAWLDDNGFAGSLGLCEAGALPSLLVWICRCDVRGQRHLSRVEARQRQPVCCASQQRGGSMRRKLGLIGMLTVMGSCTPPLPSSTGAIPGTARREYGRRAA